MAPIIHPETTKAYELCFLIRDGKITETEAKNQLSTEFGMNEGSASDTIRNLSRMIDGRVFHRTLNLAVTRYFLDRIWQEFGHASLLNAVKSTRLHIEYYEALETGGPRPSLRNICDEYQLLLDDASAAQSTSKDRDDFQEQVRQSLKKSAEERKRRLSKARKIPKRKFNRSVGYVRNPDVVAERLSQADGICDACNKPAPFKRSDGSAFLEVHHRIPLSEGGEDSFENTSALCPNCHREAHFGEEWQKFR